MRSVYSGRAAAYEALGDFDRALADYNSRVMLYAVEVEIVKSLEAPNREKVLKEAAGAYRERAAFQQARGRREAADLDARRAAELETEASRAASAPSAKPPETETQRAYKPRPEGKIQLINDWQAPVRVVVDGVTYDLPVGARKVVTKPEGSFTYEVIGIKPRVTRYLVAEEGYTIRVFVR